MELNREKLNELVVERFQSQSGFARELGRSRQYVNQVIVGDLGVTFKTIRRWAKVLGVKPIELLTFE